MSLWTKVLKFNILLWIDFNLIFIASFYILWEGMQIFSMLRCWNHTTEDDWLYESIDTVRLDRKSLLWEKDRYWHPRFSPRLLIGLSVPLLKTQLSTWEQNCSKFMYLRYLLIFANIPMENSISFLLMQCFLTRSLYNNNLHLGTKKICHRNIPKKIHFNPIQDGAKTPPACFSHTTSTNVETGPQNFLISFNPFATLV